MDILAKLSLSVSEHAVSLSSYFLSTVCYSFLLSVCWSYFTRFPLIFHAFGVTVNSCLDFWSSVLNKNTVDFYILTFILWPFKFSRLGLGSSFVVHVEFSVVCQKVHSGFPGLGKTQTNFLVKSIHDYVCNLLMKTFILFPLSVFFITFFLLYCTNWVF